MCPQCSALKDTAKQIIELGKDLAFGQVDELSRAFAAYLQSLGLERGDRVREERVAVGAPLRLDTQLTVTPVTGEEQIVEGSGGVEVNTQNTQLADPISCYHVRQFHVGRAWGLYRRRRRGC